MENLTDTEAHIIGAMKAGKSYRPHELMRKFFLKDMSTIESLEQKGLIGRRLNKKVQGVQASEAVVYRKIRKI